MPSHRRHDDSLPPGNIWRKSHRLIDRREPYSRRTDERSSERRHRDYDRDTYREDSRYSKHRGGDLDSYRSDSRSERDYKDRSYRHSDCRRPASPRRRDKDEKKDKREKRVKQLVTALDFMKKNGQLSLQGITVRTTYGTQIQEYIVFKVDRETTMHSMVDLPSGRMVSYAQHFQEAHGLTVTDMAQPLLWGDREGHVKLAPEFAFVVEPDDADDGEKLEGYRAEFKKKRFLWRRDMAF